MRARVAVTLLAWLVAGVLAAAPPGQANHCNPRYWEVDLPGAPHNRAPNESCHSPTPEPSPPDDEAPVVRPAVRVPPLSPPPTASPSPRPTRTPSTPAPAPTEPMRTPQPQAAPQARIGDTLGPAGSVESEPSGSAFNWILGILVATGLAGIAGRALAGRPKGN